MDQETRHGSLAPTRFNIAVHALVHLARDGSVWPSSELADQVNSHATFVRRIIADLVKGGIVEAKKGRGGGYVLAIAPQEITLGQVHRLIHELDTGETDQPCLSEPPHGWMGRGIDGDCCRDRSQSIGDFGPLYFGRSVAARSGIG